MKHSLKVAEKEVLWEIFLGGALRAAYLLIGDRERFLVQMERWNGRATLRMQFSLITSGSTRVGEVNITKRLLAHP